MAGDSPYFLLSHMVARFRSGDIPPEDFEFRLDECESKLEDWFQELEENPPPYDFPEGKELVEVTQMGLYLFLQSIEALREFARGGSDELIANSLKLALAAHERIVAMHEASEDYLDQLAELDEEAPTD